MGLLIWGGHYLILLLDKRYRYLLGLTEMNSLFHIFLYSRALMGDCHLLVILLYLANIYSRILVVLLLVSSIECLWFNLHLWGKELLLISTGYIILGRCFLIEKLLHKQLYSPVLFLPCLWLRWTCLINNKGLSLKTLSCIAIYVVISDISFIM